MVRWPASLDRLRPRTISRLAGDRRGAAAVEFALVSVVFVLSLCATLSIALVIFLRLELDYATSKAARQIMNGTVQKSGYSADSFRTQLVCGALPAVFDCGSVVVNVKTAVKAVNPSGYYAFVTSDLSGLIMPSPGGGGSYDVGVQGSYVYLQVVYPISFLPSLVTSIIGNGKDAQGNPAYLAVSTAAFRNEQF
jgi:Flp pilus assembly protein TadG